MEKLDRCFHRFQISGSSAFQEEDSAVLLAGSGSQQERGRPGPRAQLVAGGVADEGWMQRWVDSWQRSDTAFQRLRDSCGVPMDRCASAGSVSTEKG